MFGFKKPEPQAPVVIEEVKPVEPEVPVFKPAATTLIGKGITMVGDFESKDPIVINGTLQGNISSTNTLTITNTGSMKGQGNLESATIEGSVDGKIVCDNNAHFSSTGQMVGILETATLQTEDGAEFKGELRLVTKKAEPAPTPAPAPAEEAAPEEKPAE